MQLTRRHNVTIIVIDHPRKQANVPSRSRRDVTIDDIKGSGGKAQNADAVIRPARTRDRRQLKLQCYSKDFDEPVRILLNVAPRGSNDRQFTFAGELEPVVSNKLESRPWNHRNGLKDR